MLALDPDRVHPEDAKILRWAVRFPPHMRPRIIRALKDPQPFIPPRPATPQSVALDRALTPGQEIGQCVMAASEASGFSLEAIIGRTKDTGPMRARQMAMFLARRFTGFPMSKIGRVIGGRDHSTVLLGIRNVEAHIQRYQVTLTGDLDLRETAEKLWRSWRSQPYGEAAR